MFEMNAVSVTTRRARLQPIAAALVIVCLTITAGRALAQSVTVVSSHVTNGSRQSQTAFEAAFSTLVGLDFSLNDLPAHSTFTFRYQRPGGSIAAEYSASPGNANDLPSSVWWYVWYVNLDDVGTWELSLYVNGRRLVSKPFTVYVVPAQEAYFIDNLIPREPFNDSLQWSDPQDTEDCWAANSFTARAGATHLTAITFRAGASVKNGHAEPLYTVVTAALYRGKPHNLTLVAESVNSVPLYAMNEWVTVPLAKPILVDPGETFTAALLVQYVAPNDFPFCLDSSGSSGDSWYDVGSPVGTPGSYMLQSPNYPTPNGAKYPGTSLNPGTNADAGKVMLRVIADENCSFVNAPNYRQWDDRWKLDELDPAHPGHTIWSLGCAMTDVVNLLGAHGFTTVDLGAPGSPDAHTLDPHTFNQWLQRNNGYLPDSAGNLIRFDWSKVDVFTGGRIHYLGAFTDGWPGVNQALAVGLPVILHVQDDHHVADRHWVLATGKCTYDQNDESQNDVILNDPGFSNLSFDRLNNSQYQDTFTTYQFFALGNGQMPPTLTVEMHSPAEILLTDDCGRQAGFDPLTGKTLREVPSSAYGTDGGIGDVQTGELAIPDFRSLYLSNDQSGPYQVSVVGTGSGEYRLDVRSRDSAGHYRTLSVIGATFPGKVDQFHVATSADDADKLVVTNSGRLSGAGTLGEGSNRVTIAAQIASNGSTPSGHVRFVYAGGDGVAVSTDLDVVVFHEAGAEIEGGCTLRGKPGYRFRLNVTSNSDRAQVDLKLMDSTGKVVSGFFGPISGSLTVTR